VLGNDGVRLIDRCVPRRGIRFLGQMLLATGDFAHRLIKHVAPANRVALLVASSFGLRPSLTPRGASANQIALELPELSENGQHQTPARGGAKFTIRVGCRVTTCRTDKMPNRPGRQDIPNPTRRFCNVSQSTISRLTA
jgi:hypothetical protein